jgi:hypothetical protein
MAVCVVFSVVFTETLIAEERDHDCIGEGCPICIQIEAAKNFLKTFKFASFSLLFAAFLALSAQKPPSFGKYFHFLLSSVALKVRFNS